MAVIDLNNLIRPKKQNDPTTNVISVNDKIGSVYVDLHLDLILSKNIGLGNNVVDTADIVVDTDVEAIKNSIRNIFNTKKGQKILNPEFGSSLDQYLFSPINDTYAKAIGNEILNSITNYEPRVSVLNIDVMPQKDKDQYYITVYYNFLEINKQNTINIIAKMGGEVSI